MTLLRQHIISIFLLAPKPVPEISLRRRERSPLLDGLRGHAWANLSSALMRSRVHDRNRDRGGESIRLALAVGVIPVPPKIGIPMEKDYLILKRASASRPSGEWNDDDFDVLANGEVVGRIFKANAASVGSPWMWTLAFGYHRDRAPNHGYAASREAAMAAFARSWRRE
jgi:hypothetical protein